MCVALSQSMLSLLRAVLYCVFKNIRYGWLHIKNVILLLLWKSPPQLKRK